MRLATALPLPGLLTLGVMGALGVLAGLSAGCSGGSSTPVGACTASDPSCNHLDATADIAVEAAPCVLTVDDAGVTLGCGQGGTGSGDHDDGGGAPAPPPPDAALDASNLPFGASCWNNGQCASGVCFDYTVRGTFCSLVCTATTACPAPSPGCNGMGVCRQPDPPDGGGDAATGD